MEESLWKSSKNQEDSMPTNLEIGRPLGLSPKEMMSQASLNQVFSSPSKTGPAGLKSSDLQTKMKYNGPLEIFSHQALPPRWVNG